jgi:hypothetical protein
MAPTLAMSLTGVQVVHLIGWAAPLAYLLADAAVLLIGFGFARLSAAFSHAGPVYAGGDPAIYRGRGIVRYRLLRVLRQRAGPWIRGRLGGCHAVRAFDGTPR